MFDVISGLNRLCDKYGDEFNWGIVPQENGFVKELKIETDISQFVEVKAIARSYSCDDVLFVFDNSVYRVYHLTYSSHNENGFPKFEEFIDAKSAIDYIEKQFIEVYI